jgi:hypothetical protein
LAADLSVCALQGGVLTIRAKKAHALVRKPWYKGGRLSKASAQLVIKVCDQSKKSARVEGNEPAWVLHFLQLLGLMLQ